MESVITVIYLGMPKNMSKFISLRTDFSFVFLKHYWVNWRLLQYNVYSLIIILLWEVNIPN